MSASKDIALALKAQITVAIRRAMNRTGTSQVALAQRMGTSRAVVTRLLKDRETSLTLTTLSRAMAALDLEGSFVVRNRS